MMKKVLGLLLSLLLALSLCAASFAEEAEEIPGTVDVPYAGFRFVPPEVFRDTAGMTLMDGIVEIRDGVYFASWTYYAMTEEERTAWLSDRNPESPVEARVCPLFFVLALGNGMTFRSFNALNGNAIPAQHVRELGRLGGITYCLYMEEPNPDFIDSVDPPYKDEYVALASAADDIAAGFSFYEPREKPDPFAGLVGSCFAFTASDLDGNPVSSAELFAPNDVTVVNLWATWCGPCIGELEALQEMHIALRERGGSVIGILLDDDPDAARRLIAEHGVTYPVIRMPASLPGFIQVEAVPTTLFIGPDGTVLAAPVVGAYPDRYEAVLDSLLGQK